MEQFSLIQRLQQWFRSWKTPTVGLIGYYGWGNYGDELFKIVLKDKLPGINFIHLHTSTEAPYFPDDFDKRLAAVDAVLIGGGDLLVPWATSPLYWNPAYLKKPVFIYGVGVPTWGGMNDAHVSGYREFLTHPSVQVISARDPESAAWIRKHIIPDEEKLGWAPDIACAADFAASPSAGKDKVFGLITRAHQPANYYNFAAACKLACDRGYRVHHIVLAMGKVREDDLAEAQQLLFRDREIVVREDVAGLTEAIGRCSVLASMKFHGCVTAAMMGIPVIALSDADKFVSFYRLLEATDLLANVSGAELTTKLSGAMETSLSARAIRQLKEDAQAGLQGLGEDLQRVAREPSDARLSDAGYHLRRSENS